MQKFLITILVTIILVLMFALQNPQEIENLNFAFWEFTTQPALIILVSVFLGVIIGIAFIYPALKKRNKKIDQLSNNLKEFRTKERDKVEEE